MKNKKKILKRREVWMKYQEKGYEGRDTEVEESHILSISERKTGIIIKRKKELHTQRNK